MGSVCRQRDVDQHPCWHDARPEQEGEPHPGVGWPRSDQISDEVRPVRPGYAEHDLRRRVRSSPKLKFISAENEAGWATHILERADFRSEEHTSELQSLMRISYAVFCFKKKINNSI